MRVRPRINQLRRDANFVAYPLHGSFEDIGHPKFPRDLADASLPRAAVAHHGSATGDLQVRDSGEVGQDLILHTVGEKRVLLVAARILERQHGNALVWNRRGRRTRGGHGYRRRSGRRRECEGCHRRRSLRGRRISSPPARDQPRGHDDAAEHDDAERDEQDARPGIWVPLRAAIGTRDRNGCPPTRTFRRDRGFELGWRAGFIHPFRRAQDSFAAVLQRLDDRSGIRKTSVRVLRQQLRHHGLQACRQVRQPRQREGARDVQRQHLVQRTPAKRRRTHQHFPQHAAERIQIGASIQLHAFLTLFGAGIHRGPAKAGGQRIRVAGQGVTRKGARQPEVDNLHPPGCGLRFRRTLLPPRRRPYDHHIARFQIAMDDTFGVNRREAERDLFRETDREQWRQRATGLHPVA